MPKQGPISYVGRRIAELEEEIAILRETQSLLRTRTQSTRRRTVGEGRKPHRKVDERKIRDWIVAQGSFDIQEMAKALDISKQTVIRRMESFTKRGMVEVHEVAKPTGGVPKKVYSYINPQTLSGPNHRPRTKLDISVTTPSKPRTVRKKKIPKTKNRELNEMLVVASEVHWRIVRGGKHLKVYPPVGEIISVPLSPSDHRSVENTRAEFRRRGLPV